ncbi:hypothetical protein V8C86DRAFT_2661619, partial [Haematococcus lacustris]
MLHMLPLAIPARGRAAALGEQLLATSCTCSHWPCQLGAGLLFLVSNCTLHVAHAPTSHMPAKGRAASRLLLLQ